MKEFKVENHESSFLPDGNWELVWADEFDGTELDRTEKPCYDIRSHA